MKNTYFFKHYPCNAFVSERFMYILLLKQATDCHFVSHNSHAM